MKRQKFLILIILCVVITGCKDKKVSHGVSYRPENFPEILVPLENATEIRYLSPETGRIVEGAYDISFWLDDEYPAEKTIEQIQSYLKSQNCIRVEGSVLSDLSSFHFMEGEGFNKKVVDVSDEIKGSLKQSKRSTETQWQNTEPLSDLADVIHSSWHEEWITVDDELIRFYMCHHYPREDIGDKQIFATLSLSTPKSWIYPHVLRYKKKHPKQFDDSNSL